MALDFAVAFQVLWTHVDGNTEVVVLLNIANHFIGQHLTSDRMYGQGDNEGRSVGKYSFKRVGHTSVKTKTARRNRLSQGT